MRGFSVLVTLAALVFAALMLYYARRYGSYTSVRSASSRDALRHFVECAAFFFASIGTIALMINSYGIDRFWAAVDKRVEKFIRSIRFHA